MEKQPKNSGELSPEEQFEQDLNDATEYFVGVVMNEKGDEFLAACGVQSFEELSNEQISEVANKYRASKEKQGNGSEFLDKMKRKLNKKMGNRAIRVATAVVAGTVITAAGATVVGIHIFGNKEDKTAGDTGDTGQKAEQLAELPDDNNDNKTPEGNDSTAEFKETIEYNQHLYFNDPAKIGERRSTDAICAAETVLTDAFENMDEDAKNLLREGRTEENAEAYDKACKDLLDRGLIRNCEDSHQTTAAYAKRLIDKSNGDYFKQYGWEGLSQDEIEAKIDEMSDEEYAELMSYTGDIFSHAAINGITANGIWYSHFQRDYDPDTKEKLTDTNGNQVIKNYDGPVRRNNSEETEMHLCKVDEEGNFIEGEYYESTQVVRANVEYITVTMDENNVEHIVLHDSSGAVLEYCLQFEDKDKPSGTEEEPDEPVPEEENDVPEDPTKNKDAEIANAGSGSTPMEVSGPADSDYDPSYGQPAPAPSDQGQAEGASTGDVDKSTPSVGEPDKSIADVQADADKTHDGEVTPGDSGVSTDDAAREEEGKKNSETPPAPASGANGGMTQQEEADYMSQYDGYGQQQA